MSDKPATTEPRKPAPLNESLKESSIVAEPAYKVPEYCVENQLIESKQKLAQKTK